jgi:hypothetical protein
VQEDVLIKKVKALIEDRLGWGDSAHWTNQDFHELSDRILEATGVNMNAVTLKRIWGRVKYTSAPSTTTLDTLARFVGYENWRAFKSQGVVPVLTPEPSMLLSAIEQGGQATPAHQKQPHKTRRHLKISMLLLLIAASIYGSYSFLGRNAMADPQDYHFSSKTAVIKGVPNSVLFDIDARKATDDSVLLQQSWDERLQVTLPKEQRQHTAIYYYPGNFTAKLLVKGNVVKQHNLLIQTNGWLPLIEQFPVPLYLKNEEVRQDGKMEVDPKLLETKRLQSAPAPPYVAFYNTRDFGAIYSDDFQFETVLKNTYTEGAGICQKTYIMLQCIDNMIWIPLCEKGCVSDANLMFTNYARSGKRTDLSTFGVDFSDAVKLRIEAKAGNARIYINGQLAYTIAENIARAKIIGIGFRFQGSGLVDYVKLWNGEEIFEDRFE